MNSHHTHDHDTSNPISFEEKLAHLLEHWLRHNDDHVENYRKWARLAKEQHQTEAAIWIEEAALMTETISLNFKKALSALDR